MLCLRILEELADIHGTRHDVAAARVQTSSAFAAGGFQRLEGWRREAGPCTGMDSPLDHGCLRWVPGQRDGPRAGGIGRRDWWREMELYLRQLRQAPNSIIRNHRERYETSDGKQEFREATVAVQRQAFMECVCVCDTETARAGQEAAQRATCFACGLMRRCDCRVRLITEVIPLASSRGLVMVFRPSRRLLASWRLSKCWPGATVVIDPPRS